MANWIAIAKATGDVTKVGDLIENFRGERMVFLGIEDGKVKCRHYGRELVRYLYPTTFPLYSFSTEELDAEPTEASRALDVVTSFLAYVRANSQMSPMTLDELEGLSEMWAEDLGGMESA